MCFPGALLIIQNFEQNSKLITLPNMESQAKNHQKLLMLLPPIRAALSRGQ